ncbi:MAG: ATP-dependent zinc metalloprotease FtsH, partial [Planctomycetaceae bacterium]|nr:ATP-dependent zinc metalloprotease FtsH [Planctomycetaceae bacterium]
MADPETPQAQPPEAPKRQRPSGGNSSRPDRPQSSNLFWWLVLGGVFVALVISVFGNRDRAEELKLSEFMAGLQASEEEPDSSRSRFNRTNVHNLVIGSDYIRFQDQPKKLDEQSSENARAVKYYRIPAFGMTDDKAELTKMLREKGIDFNYAEPPPEWQALLTLLLPLLLLIVFFMFIFRRMGGAGSAMSFGRSRGRLFAQEDIETTFSDVAGIEEAVEELREVVEFLRTPGKYQALGGRIPRGVLLVGPPGTGKTLLAKAVAGEAGVPFFSLSGSDFVEMFVGVGAARVRDMFQQAGSRSPSMIFIDELDALGKVRGSGMPGGHDEREQTLNALLVEMDGFSSDQSVIVMGATNRPETLDPALMRPGRFDRHVLVDRPDVKGREAILKVHAARIKMDSDVDLKHMAKLTPGFVGADLANLVNEAALLAARNNKPRVTMHEFEEGVERVVAGLEKHTRIIHPEEKLRVAYHECGHALVACSLPGSDPVHKISIIPRGLGALGYTLQRPEDDRQLHTQTELENRICVLLGGIWTEDLIFNEISTGAQNDLQRATDIARRMVTEFGMSPKLGRVHYSETQRSPFLQNSQVSTDYSHSEETVREIDLEVRRLLDEASATVQEILVNRRDALEQMSRELMEVEVMDADHLKRILDEHRTTP